MKGGTFMGTAQKRQAKPVEMLWITSYLAVRDVQAAMDYYERVFGFEKGESMSASDGTLMHGSMKYKGAVIVMVGRQGMGGCQSRTPATSGVECPIGLYVYCEDVGKLYEQAKAHGANIVSEPEDMFWGDRIAVFKDLDGYNWTFATNVADFDASKAPR